MTKLFVYPYASGSESAKLLAERLGAMRIKLSNSEYNHKPDNLLVNWGNSNCPFSGEGVLNQPSAIKQTVDKLRFFRLMMQKGLSGYLPTYWTNSEDIPDEAFPIFCRTTTTGLDGNGIVIANKRSELVAANLYTSFMKDTIEYRVTLFRGEVTDIQTKLPRIGVTNTHPMIRTYKNGWGFQRKPVADSIQAKIVAAAKAAVNAAGLDFGGVDVLYNGSKACVLEVNTAMGLEGDALDRFAKAIEGYVTSIQPPAPVAPPAPPVAAFDVKELELKSLCAMYEKGDWSGIIKVAAGRLA